MAIQFWFILSLLLKGCKCKVHAHDSLFVQLVELFVKAFNVSTVKHLGVVEVV